MAKPLPPHLAWQRLDACLEPLPEEEVPRRQAAGRVLARGLTARVDVPALDVSAMDGYAVAGPLEPGESRPVVATIAAGAAPGLTLTAPAVARIMTGAPVPTGADRVIPVEQSTPGPAGETGETVAFQADTPPGEHIRRRGEVLRQGEPLLPPGVPLTPGALALLATHGYATVPVHRRPSVAVLVTGDEVVSPDSDPAPGQLRDSHTDFLLAAGAASGLSFVSLGIAPDRPAELAALLRTGLETDVLLVTGGVSMGEFDFVESALASLGCRVLFDAVAIQPGKPLVAAVHGPQGQGLVFGLPGNPASVMVSYWLFVRPALHRLMGHDDGFWNGALAATLTTPVPGAGPRDRFLPADIVIEDGRILATPYPPKGSHDLAAYAHGTALVRLPAGSPPTPAGSPCEVLPIAGWG